MNWWYYGGYGVWHACANPVTHCQRLIHKSFFLNAWKCANSKLERENRKKNNTKYSGAMDENNNSSIISSRKNLPGDENPPLKMVESANNKKNYDTLENFHIVSHIHHQSQPASQPATTILHIKYVKCHTHSVRHTLLHECMLCYIYCHFIISMVRLMQ